jgi:hypothetical protein
VKLVVQFLTLALGLVQINSRTIKASEKRPITSHNGWDQHNVTYRQQAICTIHISSPWSEEEEITKDGHDLVHKTGVRKPQAHDLYNFLRLPPFVLVGTSVSPFGIRFSIALSNSHITFRIICDLHYHAVWAELLFLYGEKPNICILLWVISNSGRRLESARKNTIATAVLPPLQCSSSFPGCHFGFLS